MRFKEFIVKEEFEYLDPNMSGGLARSGDSDAIAELQTWLNSNGYDSGDVDGKYGPNTARAVRNFQQDAGIKVDGDAGPQTIRAMIKKGGGVIPMNKAYKKVKPTVDRGLVKGIEDNDVHDAAKGEMQQFLGQEINDDDSLQFMITNTVLEVYKNKDDLKAGIKEGLNIIDYDKPERNCCCIC